MSGEREPWGSAASLRSPGAVSRGRPSGGRGSRREPRCASGRPPGLGRDGADDVLLLPGFASDAPEELDVP